MLRIFEIIIYTFFLIGCLYILLRRPTIIGYYFPNILSLLNLGLLIYFTNFHVSVLGVKLIISLLLVILFASFFVFIFIPLHSKYMEFKQIQVKQGEKIDTHKDLIIPKTDKIIISMIFWGSASLVFVRLIVSKKVLLEDILSVLPTYSYFIILAATILMFLAALLRIKEK